MGTFTFDELSDRAKERVRDRFRETELDYDWYEHIYQDAVIIGALLGVEIGENISRTRHGKSISSPSISFSGFSSQGDGCSFAGRLRIHELQFAPAKLAIEIGAHDAMLDEIAAEAVNIYTEMSANWAAHRLHPPTEDEDLCTCDRAIRGDFLIKERPGYTTALDGDYDFSPALDKRLDAFVTDFASWIYKQLETEHDFRMADAQIEESIKSTEQMFDEDGNEV